MFDFLLNTDNHPMISFLNGSNVEIGVGFVNMSANWFLVSILVILSVLFLTASLKKWYLIAMCLVLGFIFGALARVSAPILSSNRVQ